MRFPRVFVLGWEVQRIPTSSHSRAGFLALNDNVHADDKISIVCDHDLETAWDCFRHYNGIRRAHDLIRKQTISLSFADDEYFPALQAADMIAYLAPPRSKTSIL
jgi:hypothetical protein